MAIDFDTWADQTLADPNYAGYTKPELRQAWVNHYGLSPDEPAKPAAKPGLMSDTANLGGVGMDTMAQTLRWGVGKIPVVGEHVVNAIDSLSNTSGEKMEAVKQGRIDALSPEMKSAIGKEFVTEDPATGDYGLGPALTDWRSWYGTIVQSLPGTVATMGPSMSIGRAIGQRAAAKAIEAGATKEAAAALASQVGEKAAMYAGSVLEGGQQGAQSGMEVEQTILDKKKVPDDVLENSEFFQDIRRANPEWTADQARAQLANNASLRAALVSGVVTAVFAGQGDRVLYHAFSKGMEGKLLTRMGKTALGEAAEEFPQGFGSKMAENEALQQANPDQRLTQGAMNEGVSGAVAGFAMGGTMGVASKQAKPGEHEAGDALAQQARDLMGQRVSAELEQQDKAELSATADKVNAIMTAGSIGEVIAAATADVTPAVFRGGADIPAGVDAPVSSTAAELGGDTDIPAFARAGRQIDGIDPINVPQAPEQGAPMPGADPFMDAQAGIAPGAATQPGSAASKTTGQGGSSANAGQAFLQALSRISPRAADSVIATAAKLTGAKDLPSLAAALGDRFTDKAFWGQIVTAAGTEAPTIRVAAMQAMQIAAKNDPSLQPTLIHIKDAATTAPTSTIPAQRADVQAQLASGAITLREAQEKIRILDAQQQAEQGTPRSEPQGKLGDVPFADQEAAQQAAGVLGRTTEAVETPQGAMLREPKMTQAAAAVEELKASIRADAAKGGSSSSEAGASIGSAVESLHAVPDTNLPGIALARAFAEKLGRTVVVVDSDGTAAPFNGASLKGSKVLYIHAKTKRPALAVIGHELLHTLSPELKAKLVKALMPMIGEAKITEKMKLGLSRDAAIEEVLADVVGNRFTEAAFWKFLERRDPGLFRDFARRALQVLDRIIDAMKSGLGLFGADEGLSVKQLNRARYEIAKVLDEHAKSLTPAEQQRIGFDPNVRGNRETIEQIEGPRNDEPPAKVVGRAPITVTNTNAEPSSAQANAGNYLKGTVLDANGKNFEGLDMKVETKAGDTRRSKDPKRPWEVTMQHHYGYVRRTVGADGEQVDVYVVRNPLEGAPVFVFDQYHPNGKFDEHKAVIGAATRAEAEEVYDSGFSDGSGPKRRRGMKQMSMPEFKQWLKSDAATKPVAKRDNTIYSTEAKDGNETNRDRAGRQEGRELAPLAGAPAIEGATGPDPRIVAVAEQYAKDNGIKLTRQPRYVEVNEARAKRIAAAYDAMPHAPQDPRVKAAYQNMIDQTVAQYRALEKAGYKFWLFDENNDPYEGNPWNAMRDLRSGQRMGVFATEAGFGSGATDLNVDDNPLLADTGIKWPYGSLDGKLKRVLANDVFRAVHDAMGHGMEGAGFRAQGEENAWLAHTKLFTGSAVGALTSETRGQNSWLNYGPHGEANRNAKVWDTVFADQKTGLMPEWTWKEGAAGDEASDKPNTSYSVDPEQLGPIGIELLKQARGWAIMTAENPDARQATPEENAKAMDALKADLERQGVKFVDVKGKYGNEENSLIIIGDIDPVEMAKKYRQESVLTPEGLVYQDGSVQVSEGIEVFDKKPDDFFTEIPGSAYFSAKINWDAPRRPPAASPQYSSESKSGIELTKLQQRASLEQDLYNDFNLSGEKFADQAQFGEFLNKRLGKDHFAGNYGPQALRHVSGVLAHEGILAMRQRKNAGQWYRDSIEAAMSEAAKIHPEIGESPDSRFIFTVALAVTSNGQTIEENVKMAFQAYRSWVRTGEFSDYVSGGGERGSTINGSLQMFNGWVQRAGSVATLRQFMLTKRSVREIEDSLNVKISSENKDSQVYGGAVLGPKVGGGFLPNLNGMYDALTIDRWLTRTYNRIVGNMLDSRGQIQNGPRSGSERQFLREAFASAIEQMEAQGFKVEQADLQALLWYPEKDLYKLHGVSDVRAAPTDYEIEVKRYVETAQGKRSPRNRVAAGAKESGRGRARETTVDASQSALFSREADATGTGTKPEKLSPAFSQEAEDWMDKFDTPDPYILDLRGDDLRGPKIVPDNAARHAARRWMELAQNPELFVTPTSDQESLENIAYDVAKLKASAWRPADKVERMDGATKTARISLPSRGGDPTFATVHMNGKKQVWVNAVLLKRGTQDGPLIYSIIANFAHNNGLKFIGDPAGLSDAAVFRRTEQMLASALKFGTTDHLAPHERQVEAGLAWKPGDTEYNIAAMLAWSHAKVIESSPTLQELRYDVATGDVVDSEGAKLDRAALDAMVGGPENGARAGSRTAKRTIATQTFLDEYETGGRDITGDMPESMRGVSYSKEGDAYQGHLPDGSSVQKHSAGDVYPHIVYGKQQGSKVVYGVISPNNQDGTLVGTYEEAYNKAKELKAATQYSVEPKFFSQLANTFEQAPARLDNMSGKQWALWLDSNAGKSGVKKEEIEWTGIKDFLMLAGDDKTSREAIMAYLKNNGVQVQTVMLPGELRGFTTDDQARLDELDRMNSRTDEEDAEFQRLIRAENNSNDDPYRPTPAMAKFNNPDYRVPGGENYREVLLTLPVSTGPISGWSVRPLNGQYATYHPDGYRLDDLAATEAEALAKIPKKEADGFMAGHWDEPNVLAHMRVDDRVDADGKRVLFLNEIQSDWGQQGRDKGFGGDPGVPKGPFVQKTEAWVALAIKRAIMLAVEGGHDRVAFVTGEQAADFFDLSKSVSRINYLKKADGTVNLVVFGTEGGRSDAPLLREDGIAMGRVGELVGKEIAEKVGKASPGAHVLSGLDLKIGGEGMRAFYDKIVPQVANDVLKKIGGGKVGKVSFQPTEGVDPYDDPNVVIGDDGMTAAPRTQPGFDITPAMREVVTTTGLPLFSKELPDWIKNGSPELQAVASKIDTYAPAVSIKTKVKAMTANWKERLVQGMFDAYAPLKRLDPRAYIAARMVKSSDGVLEGTLMYGIPRVDADGAIYGDLDHKGFLGAMQELQGEHDRFFMWVAGNRAGRLMGEERERLFTEPEIAAMKALNTGTMPDGSSRETAYLKANATLNEYSKAILDIAEAKGTIDHEARKVWEHEFYVPFFRVNDDMQISGPAKVKGLVRQQAIKQLKGGKENLGDLMENTLRNWSHLISSALANDAAGRALVAAESAGIAITAPESVAKDMAKAAGKNAAAVYFMDQGKQHWYVVDDPYVLTAITAIEATPLKGLPMDVMRSFKKALTIGTTISPIFKVRNLIRDTMAAPAQNEMSYNMLGNIAQGWSGTNTKGDDYAQMMFGGALMRFGTYLDGDHAEHVKMLINKGVDKSLILDDESKVKAAMTKLWDTWQDFGDRMENVNRAALYKQLRAQGKSHLEASYQARDMMDFSMQGSFVAMRLLNSVIPFLNARAQGLYKLGRAVKDDPKRMGVMVGAVVMASWALLLANKDDDEWKKLADWERDSFWHIRVGNVFYRVPKPFEIGAMGTIAERSLELAMGYDDMTGTRFAERMKNIVTQTFEMNPIPQMFKPMVDLYANQDSFTGRQIETLGMERHTKPERVSENTSALAKMIGAAGDYTGLSPVQVDWLVKAYAGWMGVQVMNTSNLMARPFGDNEAPTPRLEDFTGGMVKEVPAAQARYLDEFYKQSKAISEVMADLKLARDMHDFEKARDIETSEAFRVQSHRLFSSAERQISKINKELRQVRADSSLSASDKRTRMDELTARRNEIAKMVNDQALQRQN